MMRTEKHTEVRFLIFFVLIAFALQTICVNATIYQYPSRFTLSEFPANRISPRVQSCSKWNRIGETIVGNELNTHLNDLESISMIGIDRLYVIDRYDGRTRLQIFPHGSFVGHTVWDGLGTIVFIGENGTFYTSSSDENIKRWQENATQGEETNCKCDHCSRIWFDPEAQDFYIVERYRSRIIKCNVDTNATVTVAGITDVYGSSNKTLSYPYALYVNHLKDLYIADVNNHRIQKYSENATYGITVAGQTNSSLHRPYDIKVDDNGFIYIADTINHRVLRWKEGESQGEVLCGITNESGNSTLHLDRPKSFTFDFEGNLYVADIGNKRIQKFSIDNSRCLLPVKSEFPNDQWATVHQRLYASKVKLRNNEHLGMGYNPLKNSPICYSEQCNRKYIGLPVFKLKNFDSSKKTCVNKLIPEKIKVECIHSQKSNIETQIISTLWDLKENTRKSVEFITSSTFSAKHIDSSFSYAHSREIHSLIDTLIKDNSIILYTSTNQSSVRLSMNESIFDLSDDFRFVIENMPCCEFNVTVENYIREFILGYFGYTYIRNVHLGGIIQQTIVITENNRKILEQHGFNMSNETWLKDVAKEIFSLQSKAHQTEISTNTYVRYFTKGNMKIFGGNTSTNSLEGWFKSISQSPVVVKMGISSIFDLLTNKTFPVDSYIHQKVALIRSAVDRYLSNPAYCYDRCTDAAHGTCVDSGFFQFGICQCQLGWTGFNCATPIHRFIDILNTSNLSPVWNTKAGRKSHSTSTGFGKGQMPSNETVKNIFDHNIYTKYTSLGSSSSDTINARSGLNTGFHVTLDVGVCVVTGFRFSTAIDQPKRDPIMITLEGSNVDSSSLTLGKSWALLYNGSSGLYTDPGRGKVGSLQRFSNDRFYRHYRVLVVSKRGLNNGVHYSEFQFYGHSCLPETHIRTRNMRMAVMQTTSAYMKVTNDQPFPLILITSSNMNMKDTFPSQTIGAGRSSPLSFISTGGETTQSYFDIAYGSSAIKINIGQVNYVTNASFFGPAGHTGGLLAPTKPFSQDTDYTFYFFGGPGVLPPLINSFIAANLPALVAYVSANPVQFNLNDDIELVINQLDLTPQSVHCNYASLSPTEDYSIRNPQWRATMIMSLSGKISGSILYHSMKINFNFTISNGSVLIQAIVNTNDLQAFSCAVTNLAFSVWSFSINKDLLSLLQTFFSAWYQLIDTPYHLASTLNIKYNQIIIDRLNVAINKLLNKTVTIDDAARKKSISIRPSLDSIDKIQERKIDYSRWMSNPRIQSKTLSQLKIPGTHNSGSYGLTRKPSQVIYKNIEFLWNLSANSAPTNGHLPCNKDKIYVGHTLLNYIVDTTLRIAISQNRTIRQQLDDGVRFFDLRIYYDTDGSFYIQHALRGPELNDILVQVRSFLDAHSTSGELIFLSISHTNFGTDPEKLPSRVATIIQNHLKPYLYMPANSTGIKNFDFQSLRNTPLTSITTASYRTSPKVMILNTDNSDDYYYKDTVVNTEGFAGSERWTINSNGVNSLMDLIELEYQGLKKNTKSMYHISWIQTPQAADIIQNVIDHLTGNTSKMLLKQLASETNSALPNFLKNHTMTTFNLVTLDWYHISSTTNPVDIIIELN
ncbi:unnamed protein product [Adineta ricciae]|uniref:Uncharacterized protein n=1 Tax=Adineta ricciae TaxID=249248 RepID=A0A814YB65_ADIRI|nr:unnamed protein product [Adineta ricciae]CAF1226856.1 unnamed protein product [Adineta ricciae]